MTRLRCALRWLCAASLCCALPAWAQTAALRDPTLPPPAPAASGPGSAAGSAAQDLAATGSSVIVIDGQPRLVRGNQLLATGSPLGDSRIEQIFETEIVLRQGQQALSLTRYPGVQVFVAKPEFLYQREALQCAAERAAQERAAQALAETLAALAPRSKRHAIVAGKARRGARALAAAAPCPALYP